MRKVLLATTALVAVGGVSVANAADISISGNYEFEYVSNDNGSSQTSDGNLVVNASTTSDAGVTYSTTGNMTMQERVAGPNFEAVYITISSADMGTLYLGDADDDALTMLDGALGINNDIESENTSISTVQSMAAGPDITYISPNIAGLTFGISNDIDSGETGYAFTYGMAGMSVYYGKTETGSAIGAKGSLAGFTIAAGSRSTDNSTDKARDIAVKYKLDNGITLAAVNVDGTIANVKTKYSNIGASYGITDGVTLKIEVGDGSAGNYSTVNLQTSF